MPIPQPSPAQSSSHAHNDTTFGPVRSSRRAAIAATDAINKQYLHPYRDPEWLHYPQTAGKYERVDHGFSTKAIAALGTKAKGKKTATATSNHKGSTKGKKVSVKKDQGAVKTERPGGSVTDETAKSSVAQGKHTVKQTPPEPGSTGQTHTSEGQAATTVNSSLLPDDPASSAVGPTLADPTLAGSHNALYSSVPSTSSERRFWRGSVSDRPRGPPLFAPLSPSLTRSTKIDIENDDEDIFGVPGPAGMGVSAPLEPGTSLAASAHPNIPLAEVGRAPDRPNIWDPHGPITLSASTDTMNPSTLTNASRSQAAAAAQNVQTQFKTWTDGFTSSVQARADGGASCNDFRSELIAIQEGISSVMADLSRLIERSKTLLAALRQDGTVH